MDTQTFLILTEADTSDEDSRIMHHRMERSHVEDAIYDARMAHLRTLSDERSIFVNVIGVDGTIPSNCPHPDDRLHDGWRWSADGRQLCATCQAA